MAKNEHKHTHHSERTTQFKGYTLQELHYRKMVNKLKIDLQKERLNMVIGPARQAAGAAEERAVTGLERLAQYANMALLAYRLGRRAVVAIRSLRGCRC